MFRASITSLVLFTLVAHGWAQTEKADVQILRDAQASWSERYAAQEIRRYIYVRTGSLLEISTSADQAVGSKWIVVGTKDSQVVTEHIAGTPLQSMIQQLEPEQYSIQSLERDGRKILVVAGGNAVGTLYAAYRLAEHLGIRFYLHGDVVPDEQEPFVLPELKEIGRPLFRQRGIQPFHDFPEGPDWWNGDDYKAIFAQLPKLRMNFFGLHTYPEGGVGPEPTVWIGPPAEVAKTGWSQQAIRHGIS